jgi:hypothetical protein
MFPFQITDRGVTVFIDSAPRQFAVTHSQYQLIVDAIHAGDLQAVRSHTDVAESITLRTEGRVKIENDCIFINGKQIQGNIVDRILAMIAMKSVAVQGLIRFLDRTYDNCSKATIDNLFDFIEANDQPITPDGCFLAYKYVRADFTDCYTGTFDNSVGGTPPRMPRNECDDDRSRTCSTGLHVCSLAYLGTGYGDKPIIVCKVAPEDVVCVPTEYKMAKMRTEGYEVVDVLDFDDGERIKPWFDDQYETIVDEVQDFLGDIEVDQDEVEFEEAPYDLVEDDETSDEAIVEAILTATDVGELEADLATTITAAIKAIGPHKIALQTYLETLDDELDQELEDWTFLLNDDLSVGCVQVWTTSDAVDGPDITVYFDEAEEDEPEPVVAIPAKTKVQGNSKLTADQVRAIKKQKANWTGGHITLTAIGKQYGVHREQIARIFRGETWKHIT